MQETPDFCWLHCVTSSKVAVFTLFIATIMANGILIADDSTLACPATRYGFEPRQFHRFLYSGTVNRIGGELGQGLPPQFGSFLTVEIIMEDGQANVPTLQERP